jgi:hypothetical protein
MHLSLKLGRATRVCSKIEEGSTGTTREHPLSSSMEALADDSEATRSTSWRDLSARREEVAEGTSVASSACASCASC